VATGVSVTPEVAWSARGTTPKEIAAALSRLAGDRDGGRPLAYAPARVLNLVTVVERARRDELVERLERLGRLHTSRTFVCVISDGERRDLDAFATMSCELPSHPGGLAVCRERVEIELGRGQLSRLESILDPLLVGDVPTVVWSPRHREAVDAMLAAAQVVLVDSGEQPDPAAALVRAAELAHEAQVVDLAWLRTTPWRERLAAAFDPPAQRDMLARIDCVTVRHEPAAASSGLLLVGWLCAQLGWAGRGRLAGDRGGSITGSADGPENQVELRLEPVDGQSAPGLAGVTVGGPGGSLSLDRGRGGLAARERRPDGRERAWTAIGASRGEPGILADGLRAALSDDLAYGPALRSAAVMLAA